MGFTGIWFNIIIKNGIVRIIYGFFLPEKMTIIRKSVHFRGFNDWVLTLFRRLSNSGSWGYS